MDETEIKVAEWKDVRETLRYFGNKRFAQLTVFIVAEGAAVNAFLNSGTGARRLVFQIAGLFLAGIFLMMERSAVLYWKKFAARGEDIEREVTQLQMMTKCRPKERGLQSATNATYALYICTAAFWLFSLFWWAVGPAPSKSIRILVAGDGRAQYPWVERRQEDVDGINKTIAQEIERAVLAEKAQMLLWTGDLSNVNSRDNGVFKTQLLAWRQIMEPLYQKGVIVLPIRGNHEVLRYIKDQSTDGESIPDASRIWNEVFTGRYALPPNGPDGEKNLTFYYVYRSVLAIGLDDYETAKNAVDVNWLKSVLSTNKRPFIFAFGHEQAFASGRHLETETLAANKPTRDQMWEALIKAGARVYFCGHDHFYDHMSVFRNDGNPGPEMHQLVAGTAGAPFYARGDYPPDDNWKRTTVRHIDNGLRLHLDRYRRRYGYNYI